MVEVVDYAAARTMNDAIPALHEAIGAYDRVGFVVSPLGGRECDLGADRRPAVVDNAFGRSCEAGGKLAVGSQQPDLVGLRRSIPLGKEREAFAVGRPLGMMDVVMPEGCQSWLASLRGRGDPQVERGTAVGIAGIGRFHDENSLRRVIAW